MLVTIDAHPAGDLSITVASTKLQVYGATIYASDEASPTATFDIAGQDFMPSESVTLSSADLTLDVLSVTTDANGHFYADAKVVSVLTTGNALVEAAGAAGERSQVDVGVVSDHLDAGRSFLPDGRSRLDSPSGEYQMSVSGYDIIIERCANSGSCSIVWNSGPNGAGDLSSDAAHSPTLDMQEDGDAVLHSTADGTLWSTGTSGTNNRLVMQDDGALVVETADDQLLWSSKSHSTGPTSLTAGPAYLIGGPGLASANGYRFTVQSDGNAVVYSPSGQAIWSTQTAGSDGRRLNVQPDGDVVLYSFDSSLVRHVVWRSYTAGSGTHNRLVMQSDGNLVLYTENGKAVWSSRHAMNYSTTFPVTAQLTTGLSLIAADGHRLTLQADGNLVLYTAPRKALWSTHTAGTGAGNRLAMQPDGNLVLYSATARVLWSARTQGTGAQNRLVIQTDGNLVLYSVADHPIWSTKNGVAWSNTLRFDPPSAGGALRPGHFLESRNGYRLDLRTDGNLVVSSPSGVPIWTSLTAGSGSGAKLDMEGDASGLALYSAGGHVLWQVANMPYGGHLVMQTDGNLVLYSYDGQVWWQSKTDRTAVLTTGQSLLAGQTRTGHTGQRLTVQSDGNAVVYSADRVAVWSTHTAGTGAHNRLTYQTDGNLVLYSGSGRVLWSTVTPGTASPATSAYDARVVLQSDSNLVIGGMWSSKHGISWVASTSDQVGSGWGLSSRNGYRLIMREDGNAVIYTPGGRAIWTTGVNSTQEGNRLVPQRDGNLVLRTAMTFVHGIYGQGQALWASDTAGTTNFSVLTLRTDGRLVLSDYEGRVIWTSSGT